jgi:hypothetical protein
LLLNAECDTSSQAVVLAEVRADLHRFRGESEANGCGVPGAARYSARRSSRDRPRLAPRSTFADNHINMIVARGERVCLLVTEIDCGVASLAPTAPIIC